MTVEKIPDDFYERAYQLRHSGDSRNVLMWNLFQTVQRTTQNNKAVEIIDCFIFNNELSQEGQQFVEELRNVFSDKILTNFFDIDFADEI